MNVNPITLVDFIKLLDDRLSGAVKFAPIYVAGHEPLCGTGMRLVCMTHTGYAMSVDLLNEADKLLVYDRMTRASLEHAVDLRRRLASVLDVNEVNVCEVQVKVMAAVAMDRSGVMRPRIACVRRGTDWNGTDEEVMSRLLGATGLEEKVIGKTVAMNINLHGGLPAVASDQSGA